MSSSPRNTGSSNRYGGDSDYGKRRKYFYASSTRRDFKSSSNSPSALSNPAAPAPSSVTKPPLRTDAPTSNEYPARSRYRDSASSGNSSSPQSSRPNSYSKDSRYASYGSKYPYTANYYQDRSSGAYGSFSSAKRAENETFAGQSTARDASSRDMVNGSSTRPERQGFPRDSWRSERPKVHPTTGPKPAASSRFNPNNIPLSSRSGSNGLSSSISNDYKKERYETPDEPTTGRWKSYSSPRGDRSIGPSGPAARFNTPKERIRSSGLTNSVGNPKRNDSYYPGKPSLNTARYPRGGFNTENYNELNFGKNSSSREFNAKSVSPLSEGYNENSHSVENSMDTHGEQHKAYEQQEGRENEDEGEDYDDDDDEDEEDDDDDDDEEEEEEEEHERGVHEDEFKVDIDQKTSTMEDLNQPQTTSEITVLHANSNEKNTKDSQATMTPEGSSFDGSVALETTVEYPDGCNFPQTKLEAAYEQLKTKLPEDTEYLRRVSSFENLKMDFVQFPFFIYNLRRFSKFYEENLHVLKQHNRAMKKKQLSLICEYRALSLESERRRAHMEEQLKVLHPVDDDARKELEAIDIRVKIPEPEIEAAPIEPPTQSGRRGRRHGDSVTTEAEFQEILKSLKNEQIEDPVARARHVAAEIPDLILDPLEREAFKFMDSNNFVHDRSKWEDRINTDFQTNFTEAEHEMFCDAFCRSPKRFGEISRYMGGIRTFGECVMHYYITKKAVNYKLLVSQYKKKTTNKNARRKKKAKSKNLPLVEGLEPLTSSNNPDESQSLEAISDTVEAKIKEVDDVMSNDFERKGDELESEQPAKKKLRIDGVNPFDNSLNEQRESNTIEEKSVDDREKQPGQFVLSTISQSTGFEDSPQSNSHPAAVTNGTLDGRGSTDDKRNNKHITSYWSITEVEDFPRLLDFFGSKWSDIAERLTTKSATMVKNYYQRNAEKYGWDKLVAVADKRGGPPGPVLGQFSDLNTKIVSEQQPNMEKRTPGHQNYGSGEKHDTFGSNQISQQGENFSVIPQSNGFSGIHFSGPQREATPPTKVQEEVRMKAELQKPSIRSLLNNETTPQKIRDSAPSVPQRRNNLSSLLNDPSSPVPEPEPAATGSNVNRRSNSIESLLG